MDEYYSAELSRKTRRGLTESFKKGLYLNGTAPFGYLVKDQRLSADETKAPIAVEIFQRYATGESFADIIRWLDGMGIPNTAGNNWQKWNISAILKSRIYIGEYTRKDMEWAVPCPALVDKDVFEKVQKILAGSAHKARTHDFDYILSGKLYCGECGGRLSGDSTGGRGFKYRYYRCQNRCRELSYPAVQLHDRVIGALREYLVDEKLDELAAGAYRTYAEQETPKDTGAVLKQELASVEKQLQNAVNAILSGVDALTLKDAMSDLERRRNDLQAALEDVEIPSPELTNDHFRMALQIIMEKAHTDDVKQLIHTVVNRIVLKDRMAYIFINLTDEEQEPPMEKFCIEVDTLPPAPSPEVRE